MKERPILFNGAMVRALLDGSKTQTRRIIKDQTIGKNYSHALDDGRIHLEWLGTPSCGTGVWDVPEHSAQIASPYGVIGDRLWVRETHDVRVVGTELFHGDRCVKGIRHYAKVAYRADEARAEVDIDEATFERLDETESKGWAPSIHMPRWASRITLEVTGVRVERLQDISEADAKAEGVGLSDDPIYPRTFAFAQLWEQLSGKGSWLADPWVWVVEFKRIDANPIRASREAIE